MMPISFSKSKKIFSLLNKEEGSALVIAILVMVVMTVLGLGILVITDIETKISDNFRSQTQALYIAESGIERLIYYFNNPSAFTDTNGTYSGYSCGSTSDAQIFFSKRYLEGNIPSYFNTYNLSQFEDTNNDGTADGHDASNPVLKYNRDTSTAQQTFLESITPDVSDQSYIYELMVFAPPTGVEAVCTVRITAQVRKSKRTIEQVLMPGPVLAFTSGLQSGATASWNGNSLSIHWGPVKVKGTPAEIGNNLNQVPIRKVNAGIDFGGYTGANDSDRWLRVFTSGEYYQGGSVVTPESSYQNPAVGAGKQSDHQYESAHNNLFSNQTVTLDDWDYHEAKRIAQRYGTYYTMNGSGQLLLDGEGSPLDFKTLSDTKSCGIVFIDTTNQLPPSAGGTMDTISFSGSYWTEGIFYIAANWSSTGLGNGKQNQTVQSPPILQGLKGGIVAGDTSSPNFTVSMGNTSGMTVGDIILIGKVTGSPTVEELVIKSIDSSTTLTVASTTDKVGFTPGSTPAWFTHNNEDFIITTTTNESTRVTVTNFDYNFAGALYCSGVVDMQGSPRFYGSVTAEQGFASGGNPEIWFDWDLTKCDLTKYGIPNVVKGAWKEIY